MPDPILPRLWTALSELIAQLRQSRYWTERRDACEEMFKIARQSLFYLREAAEDKDPDVSHWGKQALSHLKKDEGDSIPVLAQQLENELKAHLAECGTPSAYEAAQSTKPEPTPLTVAPSSATPAASAPPDFDNNEKLLEWIEEFTLERRGRYQTRPGGAQLELPLDQSIRRQTLFVDLSQSDGDGKPIALFYSVCGEMQPDSHGWALEQNPKLTRGAFGVVKQGERNVLIMMQRRRMEDLRIDDLTKNLDYLARKADWGEKKLSGVDRH